MFLDNFSEPLNFVIGPLMFLYINTALYPEKPANIGPHFIVFGIYLIYCVLYYIQPDEFKFDSYLSCYYPELFDKLFDGHYRSIFNPDPLQLRVHIYELTLFHFLIYQLMAGRILIREHKKQALPFFSLKRTALSHYRDSFFHFIVITGIIIWVKIEFGRDIGDYFIASYASFLLYAFSFLIVSRSSFFEESHRNDLPKYQKSSLDELQKEEILQKLTDLMTREKYFSGNLASLSDLSGKIGETSHRVSQVINEKTGMNFFNWLAQYRIKEAMKLLSGKDAMKYKIEEIAEMVGYNSKATFNKAFKNITGLTPSDFREKQSSSPV
ncbi:helix-turn-helix domain-containing protein [Gaoshiqia sp. Z1-71]|uniref:helix-turn-helix domain-containing protein n=1 Tax=Gaoshiqia hydrogeniformans TaxID=3290090 RepID=UPI003BF8353A